MINLYSQQDNGPSPEQLAIEAAAKKKANYRLYIDPTGEFSNKDLAYSFWYVQHKVLLYRLLVVFLVALSIIFWVFSLFRWGEYLIFGLAEDAQLFQAVSVVPNYTSLQQHFAAQQLQVLNTHIVPSGANSYDAVSELTNPNGHFLVQFDYHYVIDGLRTDSQHAFLLPNETRIIGFLGLKSSSYPGVANLVLERVAWKRISPHAITLPKAWQDDRLNFTISDFIFTPSGAGDGLQVNSISLSLTNNSAYAYKEPHFLLGLYNQDMLVGVAPFQLPSLASLETQKIDLRTFVPNIQVTTVQVYPLINVYDPTVYLSPPS